MFCCLMDEVDFVEICCGCGILYCCLFWCVDFVV